jgi:hypothetical protein
MLLNAALLSLLTGCGPGVSATQVNNNDIEDEGDVTPPTIDYTQESDWAPLSEDFVVEAVITDEESTVYLATLNFKQETGVWESRAFIQGADNVWTATVPADELGSAGLYYYIEAVDTAQNAAYAPTDGESDPYHQIGRASCRERVS